MARTASFSCLTLVSLALVAIRRLLPFEASVAVRYA
jgi:hypothetical protein